MCGVLWVCGLFWFFFVAIVNNKNLKQIETGSSVQMINRSKLLQSTVLFSKWILCIRRLVRKRKNVWSKYSRKGEQRWG